MENRVKEPGLEKNTIRIYGGKKFTDGQICIVQEVPLAIFVNGERVVTIACTGLHLRELAVGFLRSEGYILSKEDLEEVSIIEKETPSVHATIVGGKHPPAGFRTIASSGARGKGEEQPPFAGAFHNPGIRLTPEGIFHLMDRLHRSSKIHEATHGTHCSGLAGSSGMIVTREDIGRHNTIDMLGGFMLLEKTDGADKAVVTTGRVSSEIVSKVRKMGIPVIVSHSAATTGAVSLCRNLGMTLIGYVRGGKFKVYVENGRQTALG